MTTKKTSRRSLGQSRVWAITLSAALAFGMVGTATAFAEQTEEPSTAVTGQDSPDKPQALEIQMDGQPAAETPGAGLTGMQEQSSVPPVKSDLVESDPAPAAQAMDSSTVLASPNGAIEFGLNVNDSGNLSYSVTQNGKQLVSPSDLGLILTNGVVLGDSVSQSSASEVSSVDETWNTIIGTDAVVRNHYNEQTFALVDDGITFDVIVRVFDDGVGIRYAVPTQQGLTSLEIVNERTEFRLAGDPKAFWTERSFTTDEFMWKTTPYSEMGASNLPVTFEWADQDFLSIHEADLVDYAAMTVDKTSDGALRARLVPMIGREAAVVTNTDRETPWRTLTISDRAGGLIESHLIENLNPPLDQNLFGSESEARTWVKATTYDGIWWMLQGDRGGTWHEGPNHGATTERSKAYIDFAADHGLGGLLAEGWNKGWDGSWADQDFFTQADGFNLEEVVNYGKSKGVEFITHNETGANPWGYEKQIRDGLFQYYASLGIHYMKTGYVGDVPTEAVANDPNFPNFNYGRGHNQFDQTMVNHYRYVLTEAAKNKINVDCHECVHSTGEARTYPNAISREAVRGGEYDAFSSGNTPEHTLILPFTRNLSGPMDYTPGIMDPLWQPQGNSNRGHSTAAKNLAMAVNYFSGVQMAADLPEHYRLNRGIEFYQGLPASWDETRVLSAQIGQELVEARRSGDRWFVGAMNGELPTTLHIPMSFLGTGEWVAKLFTDSAATNSDNNPTPLDVVEFKVTPADVLTTSIGRSGGQAIQLRPATEEDSDIPAYTAPAVDVVSLSAPSKASPGDTVAVNVSLRNSGMVATQEDVVLSATGNEDTTTRVGVGANRTATARLRVTMPASGAMTLRVGDQEAIVEVLVAEQAPGNLRLVEESANKNVLEWDAAEGALGYELYRAPLKGSFGKAPRARLGSDITTFNDTRLNAGRYRYVVRAIFEDGLSGPSNEVGGFGQVVATFLDPTGDDYGPGSYLYPKNGVFNAGAYDLTKVEITDNGSSWGFIATTRSDVNNPWGGTGISIHHIEYYLGDGTGGPIPARAGTNMNTESAWSQVVVAEGRHNGGGVFNPANDRLSDVTIASEGNQITVIVPKSALPGFDPATSKIGTAMFSSADIGEGPNQIRPVYDWSKNDSWVPDWRPGGGLGKIDNSPAVDSDTRDANAFDIIVGPGQSQEHILDWTIQTPAVLPMLPMSING